MSNIKVMSNLKVFTEICINVDEFLEGEIKLNESSLTDLQTIDARLSVPFNIFATNLKILSRFQGQTIYELYKEIGVEERIKEISDMEEKRRS